MSKELKLNSQDYLESIEKKIQYWKKSLRAPFSVDFINNGDNTGSVIIKNNDTQRVIYDTGNLGFFALQTALIIYQSSGGMYYKTHG